MNAATLRPTLIVWGGFWNDRTDILHVEELNSHASVTCYFLSEALRKHFEVIQIPGFDSLEIALDYPEAVGVLSCFQAGFTRLKGRNPGLFGEIKKAFSGQLASIIDFVSFHRYAEDHFFTVLPVGRGRKEKIKHFFSGASVHHMGWSADPQSCYPVTSDIPRVFLDHGNYGGADHTSVFVRALSKLKIDPSLPKFEVFFQGNNGIEPVALDGSWKSEQYDRQAKVSWLDLQKIYRTCSVFCVTHRESAGLGAIEAAMCGAQLMVPDDGSPFINARLLTDQLDYTVANCEESSLARALKVAIGTSMSRREKAHERLSNTNSWAIAAERIAKSNFWRNGS